MNNTNPLIPSGSILEQKRRRKAKILYTVFGIVALHVVPISGLLLMQGCKREHAATNDGELFADGNFQELDTNGPYRDFFETTDLSVPIETNLVSDLIGTAPEASTSSPASQDITPAAPIIETANAIAPPPVPATPEYIEHTVVPNDMFYSLAKRYGTTVKAIAEANPGATPTRLRLGQVLLIPKGSSTKVASNSAASSEGVATTSKSQESGQIYTVKKGDTLTRIAKQFDITLRNLRNENNLTGDLIRIGQKLKIPPKTPQIMAKRN